MSTWYIQEARENITRIVNDDGATAGFVKNGISKSTQENDEGANVNLANVIKVHLRNGMVEHIEGIQQGTEVLVLDTDSGVFGDSKDVREHLWCYTGHVKTTIIQQNGKKG